MIPWECGNDFQTLAIHFLYGQATPDIEKGSDLGKYIS